MGNISRRMTAQPGTAEEQIKGLWAQQLMDIAENPGNYKQEDYDNVAYMLSQLGMRNDITRGGDKTGAFFGELLDALTVVPMFTGNASFRGLFDKDNLSTSKGERTAGMAGSITGGVAGMVAPMGLAAMGVKGAAKVMPGALAATGARSAARAARAVGAANKAVQQAKTLAKATDTAASVKKAAEALKFKSAFSQAWATARKGVTDVHGFKVGGTSQDDIVKGIMSQFDEVAAPGNPIGNMWGGAPAARAFGQGSVGLPKNLAGDMQRFGGTGGSGNFPVHIPKTRVPRSAGQPVRMPTNKHLDRIVQDMGERGWTPHRGPNALVHQSFGKPLPVRGQIPGGPSTMGGSIRSGLVAPGRGLSQQQQGSANFFGRFGGDMPIGGRWFNTPSGRVNFNPTSPSTTSSRGVVGRSIPQRGNVSQGVVRRPVSTGAPTTAPTTTVQTTSVEGLPLFKTQIPTSSVPKTARPTIARPPVVKTTAKGASPEIRRAAKELDATPSEVKAAVNQIVHEGNTLPGAPKLTPGEALVNRNNVAGAIRRNRRFAQDGAPYDWPKPTAGEKSVLERGLNTIQRELADRTGDQISRDDLLMGFYDQLPNWLTQKSGDLAKIGKDRLKQLLTEMISSY
jgi:hypothetical protein